MQWLLDYSENYRAQLRQGPFFTSLPRAHRPNDLQWVHQLVHQSREFTQALCLRYSLCRDKCFQPVFARHAVEEADHPDQLIAWMKEHGFLNGVEPGSVPATLETMNTLTFCWRSAMRDPHDMQVVALNVLSEGVAFDFYSAVIPILKRLKIHTGRYWSVHADVDMHHLAMGLDLCEEVSPNSSKGQLYHRTLWQSATLYHQMLSSWVGERSEPVKFLDCTVEISLLDHTGARSVSVLLAPISSTTST